MANPLEQRARKLLVERWNAVKETLGRLNMPDPRPEDAWSLFLLMDPQPNPDEIGFEVRPVVFNFRERANHRTADMYVVVCGRLYFDGAWIRENSLLRTRNFATEVAYFRMNNDGLDHVYGAHYDFEPNKAGHPVFHAQMRSFCERFQQIVDLYEFECKPNDLIPGVLRTVRLPSAQMDFFSFVLQLCADHLINEESGQEELAAFKDLRTASAAIQGAGFRFPGFADPAVRGCMRANHWYP